LRTLLATLLALSSSPAPAISAVVERDASAGLQALAAELSAALIPINHAAARRALARLYRETRRAGGGAADEARPAAATPAGTTDAAVPSAVRVEPTRPAPPSAAPAPSVVSEAWAELDIEVEVERELVPAERVAALPVPSASELHESPPSLLDAGSPSEPEPREARSPVIETELPERERPPLAAPESAPREQRLQQSTPLTVTGQLADSESWPPAPAAAHISVGLPSCRSNIRELLASYLAQTRAEEPMTRALREMIGLAAPALPSDAPANLAKGWPA
jgi:hypothetical protein